MKAEVKPENEAPKCPSLEEVAEAMLRELGLSRQEIDGATTEELAELWDCCPSVVRERVQRLREQGKLIEGWRKRRDSIGRRTWARVVRLKDE